MEGTGPVEHSLVLLKERWWDSEWHYVKICSDPVAIKYLKKIIKLFRLEACRRL